uniref:Capsid protein n=3 Tax=viral metagenome TaxID=1070528 RepID=A0A6M3XKM7_9ZZZZ
MVVEVEAPNAKVAEQTIKEDVKPTEPKENPTIRTYTEEEFKHKLDVAVGKGLESISQRLTVEQKATIAAKAEADAVRAENLAQQEHIQSIIKETQEALSDDPDRRDAYTNKLNRLKEDLKRTRDEADLQRREGVVAQKEKDMALAVTAREFMDKYGVPLKELEGCGSGTEMELKALRWRLDNPETKEKEEVPEFDSPISSGGGIADKEFIDKISTGKLPMTKENVGRLKKLGIG